MSDNVVLQLADCLAFYAANALERDVRDNLYMAAVMLRSSRPHPIPEWAEYAAESMQRREIAILKNKIQKLHDELAKSVKSAYDHSQELNSKIKKRDLQISRLTEGSVKNLRNIRKPVLQECIKSLDIPIAELEFSSRTFNCLRSMGVHFVGDLVQLTKKELLRRPNLGTVSFREIGAVLNALSLELAMGVGDWISPHHKEPKPSF